ncbi:hypothetical protein TNCV_3534521 [Trichonephila clavipes]|nr:hypothetical protein TNCV_3534521 [Trichonephila clavipes]
MTCQPRSDSLATRLPRQQLWGAGTYFREHPSQEDTLGIFNMPHNHTTRTLSIFASRKSIELDRDQTHKRANKANA